MKRPEFQRPLTLRGLSEEGATTIARADFDLLIVKNDSAPLSSLVPLVQHCSKIKALLVSAVIDSVRGLDQLVELRVLDLGDVSPDKGVELGRLEHLEWMQLRWQSDLFSKSEGAFGALRALSVLDARSADAGWIGMLDALEELELKRGSMGSLGGIAAASRIRRLELRGVRGYSDVGPISELDLRYLRIECSTAVKGLDVVLHRQRNLEHLTLDVPTFLETVDWAEANQNLHEVLVGVRPSRVDLRKLLAVRSVRATSIAYPSDDPLSDGDIVAAVQSVGRALRWVERGGTRKSPWCIVHLA